MANSGESSHLGKSFHFKGDISGSEDIFIDGKVEGTIQLPGQIVTVGQNGEVSADIDARELVVHGKLKGNAKASDRIELARTGSVQGDLAMARISIQDGAFMQGRVDIRSGQAAPAATPPSTASRPAMASATSASSGPQQASFLPNS
ncbi:MAG TPA: polymer-forming cytoskeletal protein [Terriglobales bacterium]|jgi:cytoskeletal protein CcmA (bactofilin family)